MTTPVVVIGEALIDEVRDDRGVREFIGGAALNVAVGLSRLGVPSTLVAMVGDDEAGAHIREYLASFAVELVATPSPLGTARAVSSPSAADVFNDAARARRIDICPAARAAMADAAMVVVTCFPFDAPEQVAQLTAAAAASDAPLVIDPNPRAGMLIDRDAYRDGFDGLAAHAELVKISADDARLLYDTSVDELAARLRAAGTAAVLATRGDEGATIFAGSDAVSRPVPQLPGRVVDTMGASDAALAATVTGLLDGRPDGADAWGAVLARAVDVAAATCRVEGGLLRLPSAVEGMDFDRAGT